MASITLVKEIIKADSEEPKTENVIETEESSKTVEMQTPTGEQKEIYLIIFYQRDEEEKKDFQVIHHVQEDLVQLLPQLQKNTVLILFQISEKLQ